MKLGEIATALGCRLQCGLSITGGSICHVDLRQLVVEAQRLHDVARGPRGLELTSHAAGTPSTLCPASHESGPVQPWATNGM